MAGDARGNANSGRSSHPKKHSVRMKDLDVSTYVFVQTCILMGVAGLGYLALGWSSVVLLGGFISNLRKKDFWCLTFITFVQSARIFDSLADQPGLSNLSLRTIFWNLPLMRESDNEEKKKSQSVVEKQKVRQSDLEKKKKSQSDVEKKGKKRRPLWKEVLVLFLVPICVVLIPIAIVLGLVSGLVVTLPLLLYSYGPLACIALPAWRIHTRDYGANTGDVAMKASLTPALDVYYALVLCQGILYLILLCTDAYGGGDLSFELRGRCGFPQGGWGDRAIKAYLSAARSRCWREPMSVDGWNVIHYAASLLESQSWEDNLMGVRMLYAIIQVVNSSRWKGPNKAVRSVLLSSKATIKKLIRGPETNREHRVLAARIVAHLAGDIHLSQFPGAMQFICSLLQEETTRTDFHILQQAQKPLFIETMEQILLPKFLIVEDEEEEQPQQGDQQQQADVTSRQYVGAGGCNELILQGLSILEGLAPDHQNCIDICTTPGLLTKITAPICSDTLIEHIKISDCAEVVNGSLKVLHQLIIRAPGEASTTLRRDISKNTEAMSNLERILKTRSSNHGSKEASSQEARDSSRGDEEGSSPPSTQLQIGSKEASSEEALDSSKGDEEGSNPPSTQLQIGSKEASSEEALDSSRGHEKGSSPPSTQLQIPAMEILTQLALDTSVNLGESTKRRLIDTACCIFIDDGQVPRDTLDQLRDTAGRTLVLLSTNSKANSNSIKQECDRILSGHPASKKTVAHLTEVLDAKNNIAYSKIAAQILENLCTHSLHDDDLSDVKETLLPKVLTELQKMPSTIETGKHDEKQRSSNDEENPKENSVGGNNTENPEISDEQLPTMKELQEAFLSLILAIYVKLKSLADSNVLADSKVKAFVKKLKEIVQENCKATADSLRIVKLCGQIAKAMMEHDEESTKKHFREQGFMEPLSHALKVMSSLESCMLFSETDSGPKDNVRPLLSDIKREVQELVEPK